MPNHFHLFVVLIEQFKHRESNAMAAAVRIRAPLRPNSEEI